MPTPLPPAAPLPENEPHHHRQVAESFGSDAERYDRTRPHYPAAMVDRIIAASPGPDVLDVGVGTGIVARQFQAAGCTVLGVEPDARMADFARRSGIEVEVATFEFWDRAGRNFDAVVAGQAWHWVDPIAGAVKAAEALRPGGRLAVFWNVDQPPSELAEAFAAVYQRVVPDSPFTMQPTRKALEVYQAVFVKAADGIGEVGGFSDPQRWRFDWERSYTRDEWLDQMPTFGALTRLPSDKLAEVLEGTGAAIDTIGGSFTMRYTTVAVTAARTGPASGRTRWADRSRSSGWSKYRRDRSTGSQRVDPR
jgi:SAM-dependent methyltransferase